MVVVDEGQRRVVLAELTVPWEESIAEAHEWKLLGYKELVAEIREKSQICELVVVEVGCRDFPAASLRRFLKVIGVSAARRSIEECGEKAVEDSAWITRVIEFDINSNVEWFRFKPDPTEIRRI
ncbi:uncharacterized protein LOC115210598 [Octopus sinensis]|uniref:Uncharacterized protein LOC115210598 n=1 Tax=Octopus sinensis TaxID=2607531 RepID=A0A6P7SA42_9MOLL|nr:uncharacterized protein LOC115210598 [Octopus sinensis]